jgi:hypothetical protein
MASLGQRIDAQSFDTDKQGGDFTPLPEGIFRMEVTESEVDDKGDKIRASFKIEVIEPEDYKGKWVYFKPWVQHPNAQAQSIGQTDIARLARACGIPEPGDTDEFHLIPFIAEVKYGKPFQKRDNGVPQVDGNGAPVMVSYPEIKKFFYPDQGDLPDPQITGDAPARPAPAANDNTPDRGVSARQPAPATAKPAAAATGGARPWKRAA